MKKATIITSMLLILMSSITVSHAGWLVYHKPEFRGKVIDAETKSPLEGAVIVAIYKKTYIISGPAGGSSSIINIKEALTDQKGEFHIPSYITIIQPLSKKYRVDFIIYKPGYKSHPGWEIYPFNYVGPEYMFSKEFGTKEEITSGSQIVSIVMGIVELPKLKTWKERRKANRISISDISERKWPLLNEAIEKEDEWLDRNKNWRLK